MKKIKFIKNPIKKLIKMTLIGIFSLGFLISHGYTQSGSTIIGAGASFPYPLYAKMFERYNKEKNVRVNYQSIGSGGGVRQLRSEVVEFGATDAFLKDKELAEAKAKGKDILHIPIVLGAVSITYNLKKSINLKLEGRTLALIFMGEITKWNDPRIARLNEGVSLPNQRIIAIRRSDGSGTTSVFSSFLASASPKWKREVGVGKSLNWFKGAIGAKGNEGVTGQIKNIPGAIGYISLNYALKASLPVVAIKNADGRFIKPSVRSVSAAAIRDLPADTRISLSGQPTYKQGYPISTFTWVIFHKDQSYLNRSLGQAKALKKLFTWMVTEGQSEARSLYYAPLPKSVQEATIKIINEMKFGSQKVSI